MSKLKNPPATKPPEIPAENKPLRLEVLHSGVVYRNPNPGYQYSFACHSHLVEIAPNELICTFQRGQALYSCDSVMVQTRSKDGGKTWEEELLLHDPCKDTKRYSYHGPFLTRFSNGLLVVAAGRIDRSIPDQPLFNETTGGIFETDTIMLKSLDGGATWSKPQVIAYPDGLCLTPSCPIVELENGVWFLACDQWHGFDDPGPYRPRTVGLFSNDEGRTWEHPVTFADGYEEGKGFWHGRIVRLKDNRLFTLFWSGNMKEAGGLPLHACYGSPDGRLWTVPEPTNIPGQTNWPVDLGNGRMAAIYTVRDPAGPGFYVTMSEDGGKIWNLAEQIQIWDSAGRDKIGVEAPESYPRSHDTIAYGAPSSTLLHNGDIMLSFWCTEMSVTQIRCARLRLAE